MLLGMAGAASTAYLSPSPAAAQAKLQSPVPPGVHPTPSPDEPYVYRKENDNLYVIAEIHLPYPINEVNNPIHTQTMGLVIGSEKAALIDTGLGLADLKAFVETLTDKPIIVLNTHGHLDHVGANQLFDMSYIAEEDEQSMLSSARERRLNGYKTMFMPGNEEMQAFADENMVDDGPFEYDFIKDGDKIDLGGVELEVVAFPGHSRGSVAFLDRRDGVAFTGDSILFRIGLGTRENVATYLKSVTEFEKRSEGIETLINGHQWAPMNRHDILEERELAQAIVDGVVQGVPDPVLGTNMYYLRWKRISLRD